ncbi:MAG: NAD+ synthase, partial [Candidatus Omnitrophota bacterium]
MGKIRLGIAQINCTVGDLEGNCRKIADRLKESKGLGVDIISFPELAITGYPPEDLLLKTGFVDDNLESLRDLAKMVGETVAIIGFVDKAGHDIYNAAAVIYKGAVRGIYHKMFLPNYGVFDEKRYFKPGSDAVIFSLGGLLFGVNICEDIWHKEGPVKTQASLGAGLIININSSPYHAGRIREREELVRSQAKANNVSISYTNLVGGQDELVFDGQSMIVDSAGKITGRAAAFKEELLALDIDIPTGKKTADKWAILLDGNITEKPRPGLQKADSRPFDPTAEIYQALVLGLKDYVQKNGFKKVAVGLSGGIDSSLVAVLAADALGRDNCIGVYMPTHYSSAQSEADARDLAKKLGIEFKVISIEQIFKLYLMALEPQFSGMARDITEENLQARIRGNMLMALSNKFGCLTLTTGNKSEMSTGYATLYGDMAGGFAVIKDVPKTLVYKLAKYRNSINAVIPNEVFTKEPTAELRHNQKDRDTLPPYDILDQVLKAYVEEDKGSDEIVSMGFEKGLVNKVLSMVDKSEYKRRQSPPGIKIT